MQESSHPTNIQHAKGGECGAVDSQQIEVAPSSGVETLANKESRKIEMYNQAFWFTRKQTANADLTSA
jgi:hypothetical protein